MDLFAQANRVASLKAEPLASRLRPRSLSEVVGQDHLLAPGKLLHRAITSDKISSIILYGPPGTGKTSLAGVISHETKAHFESLNAVSSAVADLRKALEQAKKRMELTGKKTILFIDEIHRFNKAQQDVLMPDVERGNPILIGATTQNPFFSIVPALVSRSLIFELKKLTPSDVMVLLERALRDEDRGLGGHRCRWDRDALDLLCEICDGDARRALNALELAILTTPAGPDGAIHVTRAVAEESAQKKAVVYDADGDVHYDTISAFIKSMRGSDPDASLYYMAKMLYAGEDPRFIARRLVICAAEDVGNADPQALVLANAAFQVAEFIGMPEARIPLAQAVVYIACAPKSNASYLAIDKAMKDVAENRTMEIPDALKSTGYTGAKGLGRGVGYQYAHDFEGHYVAQDHLEKKIRYYFPTEEGFEKSMKDRMKKREGS